MKLLLRFAHLALHEIDDLFRLGHRVVLRHRADDGLLPSNKITEGVIRSLSEFGMICGFP